MSSLSDDYIQYIQEYLLAGWERGTIEEIDQSVDWNSLEPKCCGRLKGDHTRVNCSNPPDYLVEWKECEHYPGEFFQCHPCQNITATCDKCGASGFRTVIAVL